MMKCLLFEVDRNSLLYPSSLSTFLRPTAYSFSLNSWTELFFLRIHSCHPWTVTRLSPLRPRVHSVSWIQNFRTKWHNSVLSTQHSPLSSIPRSTSHSSILHSSLITQYFLSSLPQPTSHVSHSSHSALSSAAHL